MQAKTIQLSHPSSYILYYNHYGSSHITSEVRLIIVPWKTDHVANSKFGLRKTAIEMGWMG